MAYRSAKYYALFVVYFVLLLMFGALLLFSSCSSDIIFDEPNNQNNGLATLSLTLSMGTRSAVSTDGFEEGVGYENYLDIDNDNYRIFFFDYEKNTYIAKFNPSFKPTVSPDAALEDNRLQFRGLVPPELGSKFKIVVLANWKCYPVEADGDEESTDDSLVLIKGKTTIEDITTNVVAQYNAVVFPEEDANWLGSNSLMPFYGVRSYDLSVTHPDKLDNDAKVLSGTIVDLKNYPLPLIRAMARIEVIIDNPYASFKSVEMTKKNSKGYAAPYRSDENWKFDCSDYYSESGDWGNNYMRGVHLVFGSQDAKGKGTNDATPGSLSFKKISDRTVMEDGSVIPEKWVVYMPEYGNRDVNIDEVTSVRVRLEKPKVTNDAESTFSDEETLYNKDIYFTENGKRDGIRFDVERNNIYRFIIENMNGDMDVRVDIQPYAEQNLTFAFGLMRDSRGDLMVLPDENGNYPDYFINFINDENPNHKYPQEEDENGEPTTHLDIILEEGDYYAIVVGEYQDMSEAVVWVKDKDGCRVISNFGSNTDDQKCRARLVESFFGNNQSEKFYKDVFGYRRVYHFDNHNSIVRDPMDERLLFCVFDDYEDNDQSRKYYEVESWDETNKTGWIINKDAYGGEVGFQEIKSDGTLGSTILFGDSIE